MAIDIATADLGLVDKLLKDNHNICFCSEDNRGAFLCRGLLQEPSYLKDHQYIITKEYCPMIDLYTDDEGLKSFLEELGFSMQEAGYGIEERFMCPSILKIPPGLEAYSYRLEASDGLSVYPELNDRLPEAKV